MEGAGGEIKFAQITNLFHYNLFSLQPFSIRTSALCLSNCRTIVISKQEYFPGNCLDFQDVRGSN